jgi:hypothetical protein
LEDEIYLFNTMRDKNYHPKNPEKVGRRRFVKILSGLGVSSAAIAGLSQRGIADITENPKEEVPYIARYVRKNKDERKTPPERVPEYETISRDKLVRVEAAKDAAEKLQKQINEIEQSPLLETAVWTTDNGEKAIRVIHKDIVKRRANQPDSVASPNTNIRALEKALPSRISGKSGEESDFKTQTISNIPVDVTKRREYEVNYYGRAYRPVPAGCQFQTGSSLCTLGTPAYSHELNGDVAVTAAHCFLDDDGNQQSEDVHQPTDLSYPVGTLHDYQYNTSDGRFHQDSAVVEMNESIEMEFAENNEEIVGISTWNHLVNNEGDTTFTVTKQGRTTGRKSGYIDEIYHNRDVFRTTAEVRGGDSGGPHFTSGSGYATIAGITSFGSRQSLNEPDLYTRTGAFAIEQIEDTYNLFIG